MTGKTFLLKLSVSLALIFFGIQNIAAQIEVTGKITDCEGEPMVGVSIVIEKETKGTASDKKGLYKISVRDTNAVLVYSFIGCERQKIKVGGRTKIDVTMKVDTSFRYEEEVMVMKPVIYLYPEARTDVSVQVAFDGKFLFTYPEYGSGWNVTALPDGTLTDKKDNREYSYLFWDGNMQYTAEETTYENGFFVHKDNVVAFLQEILPQFGLTPREYNEFIVFWTPYLQKNEWNFIHFRTGDGCDMISQNTVTPQPQTEIRLFMDFRKADGPLDIAPQKAAAPERKGFTLVEWGGMELTEPARVRTATGEYREI